MAGTSTNRERAAPFRGNRRYFHRPTPVELWKVRLSLVALLLAVGWVVASLTGSETMYADSSRGPVTHAHAALDARCDACHAPFGSEDCQAGGLFEVRDRWRSFRCNGCHAGPDGDSKNYAPHVSAWSPASNDPIARDCSSCHREHQGRDFAIARVSDAACVRCHQNLKQLHEQTKAAPVVTSFSGDHPEFRVGPYSRAMKFSHALHMSPGVSHSAEHAAKNGLTPRKLPEKYQAQYRSFTATGSDRDTIQLNCSACHQLDPGRGGAAHPAGEYYLPVVFEKHCQACHSMEVPGLKSREGIQLQKFEVPHRQQPGELDRFVRGEISRQILAKAKLKLDLPRPSDRLDTPREVPIPPEFAKEIDSLARKVDELLYNLPTAPEAPIPALLGSHSRGGDKCMKCHDREQDFNPFERPKFIVRPSIPNIWLTRGRFNHSAHRTVDCAKCHPGKNAEFISPAKRVVEEPLGIPGIDTCKQCHKPARQGGVRDSCIDCHRYHGMATPAGRGP